MIAYEEYRYVKFGTRVLHYGTLLGDVDGRGDGWSVVECGGAMWKLVELNGAEWKVV